VDKAPSRKALGQAAERAGARYLKSQGYALLARNVSTAAGEIDIIAADAGTLCFIEVRSRSRGDVAPHSSVDARKQARLRAAASAYLTTRRLHNRLCRFDVLSATPGDAGWNFRLLRNAF